MDASPVFRPGEEGMWIPDPITRGPFEGMQGGIAAALMCSAVEAMSDGFVASVVTHYLKPVPLLPLKLDVGWLREGRRVGVAEAALSDGANTFAVQRATIIRERECSRISSPYRPEAVPEQGDTPQRIRRHEHAWLMDAMTSKVTSDGIQWFRLERPIIDGKTVTAGVLPAADWAHGIVAPSGMDEWPMAAIPNTDLSVHLFREPEGRWVGLEPATAWSQMSIGTGWAALHDVRGIIGRVAMSVAITIAEERG